MERQEMLKWKKAAWQKLMGAIAMLLVASIMMSATSYAWFVLSTAPEVTDLTTTAGANGALEIALQSNKADGTGRADILSGVGQSIASKDAQTANTYWGNVVDLSTGYGLEHITLYPARLNVNSTTVSGNTTYNVVTDSYLSVPTFGTDGRVVALNKSTRTSFDGTKFESGQNHYGVNVWGVVDQNVGAQDTITLTYARDIVLNEAREKVAAYRTELRQDMTTLIERNSVGIIGIMFKMAGISLVEQDEMYNTVKDYVSSMEAFLSEAFDAVRWALLANAAADEEHFSSENAEAMKALGNIYANVAQLELTGENSIQSIARDYGYTEIANAATAISAARVRIGMAKEELDDTTKSYGNAGLMLIRNSETMMHGSKRDPVTGEPTGAEPVLEAWGYDLKNGIYNDTIYTFTTPEDPENINLFSAIATLIGDYSGDMSAWFVIGDESSTLVGQEPEDPEDISYKYTFTIKATNGSSYDVWQDVSDLSKIAKQEDGTFANDSNVGALAIVSNQIEGITAPGTIRVEITRSDVSAYGYSVDLAFQSSQNTNLLLQQEGVVRVNSDTTGDGQTTADTMGGGSQVQFTIAGDLTTEQVKELVQGIYIVFVNSTTGTIYKVAALDPQSISVTWTDIPAEVTGTLALYEPSFDKDGTLTRGNKSADNVICALAADTPAYISAVVYLCGDAVQSSAFSATQGLSLDGAINLQFASSENLTAMEYAGYVKK